MDVLIVQIMILFSSTTGLLTLNNYLFAALNCDSISRFDSSDNPPKEKVKKMYKTHTRTRLRDVVIGLIA